ncbi:MAG: cytochrome c [Vicinamibacterales bacterium]
MSPLRAAAVLVIAATTTTSAQVNVSPTIVVPTTGQDIFQSFCAPCHGPGGRGNGPLSSELRTRPADLTQLSLRNRGEFPTARVQAFVMHGDPATPAHGTAEMPVWGPIFRALDPSDRLPEVRIEAVVRHVQSLQRR